MYDNTMTAYDQPWFFFSLKFIRYLRSLLFNNIIYKNSLFIIELMIFVWLFLSQNKNNNLMFYITKDINLNNVI